MVTEYELEESFFCYYVGSDCSWHYSSPDYFGVCGTVQRWLAGETAMKTECTHCKKKFLGWRAYAEHLLEKHPDDEIRCEWARYVLSPEPDVVEAKSEKRRFKMSLVRLGEKDEKLKPPDETTTLRRTPKYTKK